MIGWLPHSAANASAPAWTSPRRPPPTENSYDLIGWLGVALLLLILSTGCSSSGTSVELVPTVGEEISESSTTPTTFDATGKDATTTTETGPITGYGDFSGFGPFEIDRYATTELMVRCIQDQGFAVAVIPPGDGISFVAVPVDQNQLAVQAAEACRAGLGLSEPTAADYTVEIRELLYEYQLALRQCLISAGYDIPEPPSRDYFVDGFFNDPWNAYTWVPGSDLADMGPDSISYRCPQSPPGGLLSWKAGDPIPTLLPIGPKGA